MNPTLLTSAYLGPVHYYTKLYAAPCITEERCEHYVKQTYRNRCIIAGPDGPMALTIPVEHDSATRPATRDIRISEHGNWRHRHRTALVSAYEKSPFFEYYADDILPLYERPCTFLVDFNEALREAVCRLLELSPRIGVTSAYLSEPPAGHDDFREMIRPKTDYAADPSFRPVPYWQVFAQRNGFLPNLSIADLLFNMGPEARLVLRDSIVPAVQKR